jgi:hypothetical protein
VRTIREIYIVMTHSTSCCLVLASFVGLFFTQALQAQVVFSENFRSPSAAGSEGSAPCQGGAGSGGPGTYLFPAGWLLRNVDNNTPEGSVSYINDAWEVRDEFPSQINNCVAFSTSFYTPNGQANDFMWSPSITVPASGGRLSWRARAYDPQFRDGYEVRIMLASAGPPSGGSGVLGNQLSASSLIFTTAAEQADWITRTIRIDEFAGQAIHVGFRNNSDNKFILVIDDVQVAAAGPDLVAIFPAQISPYTRVPLGAGYLPELGVNARNNGDTVLTNVTASARLTRNNINVGAALPTTTLASLSVGATVPFSWSAPAPPLTELGNWAVRYVLRATQSELPGALANNSLDSDGIIVSTTELARHTGATIGQLGIGAGGGGELGVQFGVPNTISYVGVRFGLNQKPETVDDGMGGLRPSNWAGRSITANLRRFDSATNKPGALIATTLAGRAAFSAATYDLPFASGPQTLTPGIYVVTINEPIIPGFAEDATLPLAMHSQRFIIDSTWVNWPTSPFGGWENFEAFGPSFLFTPQISLLTGMELFKDGFEGASGLDTSTTPSSEATQRQPIQKLQFAWPRNR